MTHSRQSIPPRSTDQASARVLMLAAGASVVIHAGIAVTVLTAKLSAPPASDYWNAAPAWTTEIAFNNEPQLKAQQPSAEQHVPAQKAQVQKAEAQNRSEPTAELAQRDLQPPEPKEIEVRPGIDNSTSDSKDWIGSAIPTPHAAPKSSVNQAGQTMDPGNPGAPGATNPDQEDASQPTTSAQTPQLASQQHANTSKKAASGVQTQQPQAQQEEKHKAEQPEKTQLDQTQPELNQPEKSQPKLTSIELDDLGLPKQPDEQIKKQSELPNPIEVTKPKEVARDEQDALPKPSILGALSPANQPVNADETTEEASDTAQAIPQQQTPPSSANATTAPATKSTATGDGGNQKLPGEKTDAESAPSSIDNTFEYKPGRPLAGKGIRVRPVAARFSHTTQLTALPKNPRLIIKFNRVGRVVSVEFENKEGTGYPDVDAPLRDSIFRWTASGKALQDLPTYDPQATVTMKIEYILRPE